MRGLRAGEASGSRSPSCACSALGEREVEGWKLYLPGSPVSRLGRRGDGVGGVAQRLRSLGTIRKPPSRSERLQRLQRLQRLGAQRAARTQPTGAWALHPLSPIPPTSAMLRAVQERLTGRRAALSETGRIPAVRSLSKGPSLEQSCGRERAWRWPGGQAEP